MVDAGAWAQTGVTVISTVGALAGILYPLHAARARAQAQIMAKINKLDLDVDGLTKQIGEVSLDAERRFVTKTDHGDAIRSLTDSVQNLNGNIIRLNEQMFQAVRR